MKTRLVLIFALLLLCLGTGAVLAQQDSCAGETGAAYGLCNAYCEAMDCESDNPSASATACDKVRTKFQNITGHDLPCEVPTCPCANPSVSVVFSEVVAGTVPLTQCRTFGEFGEGTEVKTSEPSSTFVFAYESFQGNGLVCGPTNEGGELPVSQETLLVCSALLRQAAASQGVTCF